MNEFSKRIKLEFDADRASLQNITRSLQALEKTKLIPDTTVHALAEQFKDYSAISETIKALETTLNDLSGLQTEEADQAREALETKIKEYKEILGQGETSEAKDKTPDGLTKKDVSMFAVRTLDTVLKSALQSLKGLFVDAWDELSTILDYSRLSNQNTRELAFTYGFTSAEAYGFSQAQSMLGIQSEEDMWFMTEQEWNQFSRLQEKYTTQYQELYDSGFFDTLLDYQIEMEEFKQDLKLSVVQFFMDNKDTIMTILKGLMEAAEIIVQVLGWIFNTLDTSETSQDERLREADKIISGYTLEGGAGSFVAQDWSNSDQAQIAEQASIVNNNQQANNTTNANKTVSVNNTFNNVSRDNQEWLQNAGERTYKQVIDALNGG